MRKFKTIVGALGLTLLLQSCLTFEEVEVIGVEDYNVENLMSTSKDLKLLLDLKIDNPNTYAVVLKEADLNMYMGKKDLGKVRLGEKVRIPKKSQDAHTFIIIPESRKMLISALGGSLGILTKGEIEIRLKGKIKGGAFGISKWVSVNHKETISIKGKLFMPEDGDFQEGY